MDFLNKWYRRSASFDDIADIIRDWMSTDWGNEKPTLVFTYTPELTPLVSRIVEVVGCSETDAPIVVLELRFEILNSFGDSWYDEASMPEFPRMVFEFLGLDPDQEIYIDLGSRHRMVEES